MQATPSAVRERSCTSRFNRQPRCDVIREPLKALACIATAFYVNWQLTLLSLSSALMRRLSRYGNS